MSFHVFKTERLGPNPKPPAERSRRRRTKSCTPCRQLKVSCDRKKPCSRCVWSRRATECTYCEFPHKPTSSQPRNSPISTCQAEQSWPEFDVQRKPSQHNDSLEANTKALPERLPIPESVDICVPWYTPKSALRGGTHWDSMLHQFKDYLPNNEEASILLNEYMAHSATMQGREDHICPPNFPFTFLESGSTLLRSDIISRLPSRQMCDSLIERYLRTIEVTHCFFYVPAFKEELDSFWNNPHTASYEWLAQLFLIFALGYAATSPEEQVSFPTKSRGNTLRQSFLGTAEACLAKTPFMFRADIILIRVFCLIIVAKLTGDYSCSVIDSCGTLADMAIRGCMELGLNKNNGNSGTGSRLEERIRTRLWTAAVFLKVQQSANSGTPLLLRQGDFEISMIESFDVEQPSRSSYRHEDSICHFFIARSLATAIDVVSAANSNGERVASCTMIFHEREISRLLHKVQQVRGPNVDERFGWQRLQKPMLEIWLRRILFIIHKSSMRLSLAVAGLESPCEKKLLGSALAILVYQRQMLEAVECPAMVILTGLFKQDFFIAAVGACAYLKDTERQEGDDSQEDWHVGHSAASMRDTIRDALYWCKELWARDIHRSTCNFWAHLILQRLLDRL